MVLSERGAVAPTRSVHCADALGWLRERETFPHASFITSLPDASELSGVGRDQWAEWFVGAAGLVLSRCPDDGVAIFYQSDVKRRGVWIDKGYLCAKAAEREGASLLWHKIVCRVAAGSTTYGRAGYGHLLCFSKGARHDLSRATADVLPDAGPMTWVRAVGLRACEVACRYVLEQTRTRTVIDPFCGMGTVLAVANAVGLDAIGVELNRKRAARARALEVDLQNPASDQLRRLS